MNRRRSEWIECPDVQKETAWPGRLAIVRLNKREYSLQVEESEVELCAQPLHVCLSLASFLGKPQACKIQHASCLAAANSKERNARRLFLVYILVRHARMICDSLY